jgi:predicted component of type VI protein secretion system
LDVADDVERLLRIKERVEDLRAERDRAEGKLEQIMAVLEKEHGCSSLEEAEEKAEKLEKKAAKAKKEFESALSRFEATWGKIDE